MRGPYPGELRMRVIGFVQVRPSRAMRKTSFSRSKELHQNPILLAQKHLRECPLIPQQRSNSGHHGTSVMCHVWTAPAVQEANLTFCEAFGCSHVSGL